MSRALFAIGGMDAPYSSQRLFELQSLLLVQANKLPLSHCYAKVLHNALRAVCLSEVKDSNAVPITRCPGAKLYLF